MPQNRELNHEAVHLLVPPARYKGLLDFLSPLASNLSFSQEDEKTKASEWGREGLKDPSKALHNIRCRFFALRNSGQL